METYLLIKALHIIAFTSWMAGMFYLPRLFAYHANAPKGGELSETLKIMERRLLRIIINPAMILTWGFGIWLVILTGYGAPGTGGWLHAKLALVFLLSGLHGFLAGARKRFARDENTRSARFYKILNEVPTVMFIAIVLLVVLKPF
jgi:protoporphyrinogen IX oxidase